MFIKMIRSTFLVAALAIPTVSHAHDILKITGKSSLGVETVIDYSSDDLGELTQVEIVTTNNFVDGDHVFAGPLLREVFTGSTLKTGDSILLTALDDYSVIIPAEDALNYDVILATSMDGIPLEEDVYAPIWVIYPMSEYPELREEHYDGRLIWQVMTVELQSN